MRSHSIRRTDIHNGYKYFVYLNKDAIFLYIFPYTFFIQSIHYCEAAFKHISKSIQAKSVAYTGHHKYISKIDPTLQTNNQVSFLDEPNPTNQTNNHQQIQCNNGTVKQYKFKRNWHSNLLIHNARTRIRERKRHESNEKLWVKVSWEWVFHTFTAIIHFPLVL